MKLLCGIRVLHHPRARLCRRPHDPAAAGRASVIGICASAGGPQALVSVLAEIPATFAIPILVVQHIAAGFTEGFARWLDDQVPLTVRLAGAGPTGPGIWVAPEGAHLVLDRANRLVLDGRDDAGPHRPSADVLLRSVATGAGAQGVAVVLTGMGRDGAEGLGAVRRARGLTIAQDEASSAVFGMPKAAAECGAEIVLSPSAIGQRLSTLRPAGAGVVTVAHDELAALVQRESGIRLAERQHSLLQAALSRIDAELDPEAFLRRAADPLQRTQLVARLIEEVTVKETFFLRDLGQLAAIDWELLLRNARACGVDHVRVWTAACATGEEAYSLALLACEAFAPAPPPVRILATDISAHALARARQGVYRPRSVRALGPAMRKRYFREDAGRLVVGDELRALVSFARHNLVRDPFPPLGQAPFQLILCRNVLIYFDSQTVGRVVGSFERALARSGAFVLGPADALCASASRLAGTARAGPGSVAAAPAAPPARTAAEPRAGRRGPARRGRVFPARPRRARGRRSGGRRELAATGALRGAELRARGVQARWRARGGRRSPGGAAGLRAGAASARAGRASRGLPRADRHRRRRLGDPGAPRRPGTASSPARHGLLRAAAQSGMLPCLRLGPWTRLVRSVSSAAISFGRVSCGTITSSM